MQVKEKKYNSKEVYTLAKNGDENAKLYLINLHKPLIYSLLKRYKINDQEKEDLFSCAQLGLINAINRYDSSYNTEFSTYAVPLILGEIKKYFRDNNLISISRTILENHKKIVDLEKQNIEKSPSIEEISLKLNLSKEEVIEALEANTFCYSLDSPIDDSNDITLLDTFSSNEIKKDMDLILALDKLTSKEKLIINLRYYDGLSQNEVASRLHVNQVYISRIEKKILEKLKKEYKK